MACHVARHVGQMDAHLQQSRQNSRVLNSRVLRLLVVRGHAKQLQPESKNHDRSKLDPARCGMYKVCEASEI